MRKRDGLTLIEIILAIALLGIIAISLIPIFVSQFKNIVIGGGITEDAFDDQGIVEEIIFDAKTKIQKGEDLSAIPQWSLKSDVEVFGQTVEMHKLKYDSSNAGNRNIAVYLSEELAQIEISNTLSVENVSIKVSDDPNNLVADLTKAPTLTAVHDDNSTQSGYFTNLYRWWRTQPGVDPSTLSFPNDYVLISVSQDTKILSNLLDNVGANSYVVLTATPVDVNGNRGPSVMSSNMVYVRGAEWRIGAFPWVDINNNYDFESSDHKLVKDSILYPLNAQEPYPNPMEPSVNIDLSDGSLFVPMGIEPSNSSEPGNQAIEVNGAEKINWLIERNINLAKDINVLNASDIKLVSGLGPNGGTIFIHPYVRLNSEGNPVVIGGIPQLLNSGVTLSTSGDLLLETAGRGSIYLYDKAEFEANNISLRARGAISINSSRIRSNGSTVIDNSVDTFIPGSRNITLNEANFESINSNSKIYLNSPNEINFKGGSWSANQIIDVPNGKSIYFEKGISRVNNLGILNLGNTGSVRFKNSMITDISDQLRLRAVKKSDTQITLIPHKYFRNIAYSSPSSNLVFTSQNSWKDIGGSNSNIEFSASIISGTGNISDVKFSFDGIDAIGIQKNTTKQTEMTRVRLEFRDKYSNREIKGIGFFTYSIDSSGNAVIIVEEEVPLDTYTITFNSNGGSAVDSMIKAYGDPISAPPEPVKPGYTFSGWEPTLPAFMPNSSFNVVAKWTANKYEITFFGQGGTPAEETKLISFGDTYSSIFRFPVRIGYNFTGWYTSPSGNGIRIESTDTHTTEGNISLYASWVPMQITVSFSADGGTPVPANRTILFGEVYGNLPVVAKTGYNFLGWFYNNMQINNNTPVEQASNHTLTARWAPKSITVSFDSNGGNMASPNSKIVEYYGKYGQLPTPSRSNYSFEGWFTQSSGGSLITSTTDVTNATNHTLFAQWERQSSCPFVYSFDGEEYHFEHEPVPYAVNKAFETTTYGTLRKLREIGGKYHIRLSEELESETYVNGFNLYAADYKSDLDNLEIFADIFGKPHTIKERKYPLTFVDSFGVDWMHQLKTKGELIKSSSTLYDEGTNIVSYDAKFRIPSYAGKTAKLMVRTKVSDFLTNIGKWLHDITDGENNIWWIQELLSLGSNDVIDAIDIMSLEVDLWNGVEWVNQGKIEGGYHLLEEFLIPIDITSLKTKTNELKIRLRSGAGFFEIDEVSIDFTENEKINVIKLKADSMITNKGLDVKKILNDFEDDKRAKLQRGDYIDIYYNAPKIAEGYKRGYFVEFKGHFTTGVESKSNDIVESWNEDTTPEEIIGAVMQIQPESMDYLESVEFLFNLAGEISSQPLEVKIKRIIQDNVIHWLNLQ